MNVTYQWSIAVDNRAVFGVVSGVAADSTHVFVRSFAIDRVQESLPETCGTRVLRERGHAHCLVVSTQSPLQQYVCARCAGAGKWMFINDGKPTSLSCSPSSALCCT